MCKTGYNVSMGGRRKEAGNVQVAYMCGPEDGTIRECDRNGVSVTALVDCVCMFQDEMA